VLPVTLTCTPQSGSAFPVGVTKVTCTATDAIQRPNSCSFTATVVGPALGATKFLAFGDSITAGEVPDSTDTGTGRVRLRALQPALAYPAQLQTMLSQRYPAQAMAISVINDGVQGETAVLGTGRLDGELTAHMPDVLLLLEGVNDIAADDPSDIGPAINALRSMIRDARGRGAKVLVGTLLPMIPGEKRAGAADLIVPFNSQLVPMALSEGAVVVDLYSPFLADLTDWISPLDGLHPTPAGYQELALLFLNAIKANFEVPPVLTPVSLSPSGPGRALPRVLLAPNPR
jgi:lysophospholipase L1-like esterase